MVPEAGLQYPNTGWQGTVSVLLLIGALMLAARPSVAQTTLAAPSEGCFHQSPSSKAETLRLGAVLRYPLKGGESQIFRSPLTAGQYVRLIVQLRGIILRATLFDPSGNQIVVMSNPSGGFGPIYISEVAQSSGEYRLEVRSTEVWANPGSFEVAIQELRDATPEDARRVAAERSFAKGVQADEAKSYKIAIEEYEKSLSYWQSVRDSHWEALTLYVLGQTHRRSENAKKSEEFLRAALRIELDENDWRLKAATLNDLGINLTQSGLRDQGISLLNESLKLFEAHGDRRGQASSLNSLSQTYGKMGQLRKARELAEIALPLRRSENFQSGVNNVLNTLGNIYDRLGDAHKSLEYYGQALAGSQQLAQRGELTDPDRLANALSAVAIANEKLGNWDQARQYYDQALAVSTTTRALRAAVLSNKGDLYTSLGDFDTAMTYLSEAQKELDSLERADPDLKASVLLQIGQIHIANGRPSEALDYFQKARNAKPSATKLAYALIALGGSLAGQGNITEALKAYEEALIIQQSIEDRRVQAILRQKRGEAYAMAGNTGAASKEYDLALSLWRAVIDRRGEAATLNDIALLERDRNNLSHALRLNQEAIGIIESQRTAVSSHQLRTSYFALHENYYELNIDLNMQLYRAQGSAEHLAAALTSSERSRARSLLDTLTEARADISQGVSPELLQLERDIQQKLRAKLGAQTILLSSTHNENEPAAMSIEVSELIRQQDEVKGRIRSSSTRYAQLTQPQPLSLAEIQKQLDDDTLLVEYALGDKRSYVWVVGTNFVKAMELPARNQIESIAIQVTDALNERNRDRANESYSLRLARYGKAEQRFRETSVAMSKILLNPVASLLGKKRLIVVANGALQMLPFGSLPIQSKALTSPDSRTTSGLGNGLDGRLVDKHEIILLPSISVLALHRHELANRKPAPNVLGIVADPVFDIEDERVAKSNRLTNQRPDQTAAAPGTKASPGVNKPAPNQINNQSFVSTLRDADLDSSRRLRRLSFSRKEATAIAKTVPARQSFSALDFKASRETVTGGELSKYRIVHIATHGVMDLKRPELSGIVLSMVDEKGKLQDGYLRLHEIYNLDLPAELVVLSACQTGVGKQIKGEGLIALTRGFMYAGARSVVGSLWKVDDVATSLLMAEFYKQMFTHKLKPAAALREAQIKMSKQTLWQSPYYWAGFFIQGEWNSSL